MSWSREAPDQKPNSTRHADTRASSSIWVVRVRENGGPCWKHESAAELPECQPQQVDGVRGPVEQKTDISQQDIKVIAYQLDKL